MLKTNLVKCAGLRSDACVGAPLTDYAGHSRRDSSLMSNLVPRSPSRCMLQRCSPSSSCAGRSTSVTAISAACGTGQGASDR